MLVSTIFHGIAYDWMVGVIVTREVLGNTSVGFWMCSNIFLVEWMSTHFSWLGDSSVYSDRIMHGNDLMLLKPDLTFFWFLMRRVDGLHVMWSVAHKQDPNYYGICFGFYFIIEL